MRQTQKSLACLAGLTACSLWLLFLFSNQVLPEETAQKGPRIKELEQKRLEILEKIHELARKAFKDGVITHEQLRVAKNDLLSAKHDYAETREERIKICDEAVQEAKDWQKIVQEGVKAAVFSRLDELKAQSDLLEAQISRVRADDEN